MKIRLALKHGKGATETTSFEIVQTLKSLYTGPVVCNNGAFGPVIAGLNEECAIERAQGQRVRRTVWIDVDREKRGVDTIVGPEFVVIAMAGASKEDFVGIHLQRTGLSAFHGWDLAHAVRSVVRMEDIVSGRLS